MLDKVYSNSVTYRYHVKQSFPSKYPYHKVPDRKHSGRQRDLKALLFYKITPSLFLDILIIFFQEKLLIHVVNAEKRSHFSKVIISMCCITQMISLTYVLIAHEHLRKCPHSITMLEFIRGKNPSPVKPVVSSHVYVLMGSRSGWVNDIWLVIKTD